MHILSESEFCFKIGKELINTDGLFLDLHQNNSKILDILKLINVLRPDKQLPDKYQCYYFSETIDDWENLFSSLNPLKDGDEVTVHCNFDYPKNRLPKLVYKDGEPSVKTTYIVDELYTNICRALIFYDEIIDNCIVIDKSLRDNESYKTLYDYFNTSHELDILSNNPLITKDLGFFVGNIEIIGIRNFSSNPAQVCQSLIDGSIKDYYIQIINSFKNYKFVGIKEFRQFKSHTVYNCYTNKINVMTLSELINSVYDKSNDLTKDYIDIVFEYFRNKNYEMVVFLLLEINFIKYAKSFSSLKNMLKTSVDYIGDKLNSDTIKLYQCAYNYSSNHYWSFHVNYKYNKEDISLAKYIEIKRQEYNI